MTRRSLFTRLLAIPILGPWMGRVATRRKAQIPMWSLANGMLLGMEYDCFSLAGKKRGSLRITKLDYARGVVEVEVVHDDET